MVSYAKGPSAPLLNKTIHQVMAEAAAERPDAVALVSRHQQNRLTFRELHEATEQVAEALWGIGIRPGERIGMWACSCVEWVYLQVAAARIGAVLVNVNPADRKSVV